MFQKPKSCILIMMKFSHDIGKEDFIMTLPIVPLNKLSDQKKTKGLMTLCMRACLIHKTTYHLLWHSWWANMCVYLEPVHAWHGHDQGVLGKHDLGACKQSQEMQGPQQIHISICMQNVSKGLGEGWWNCLVARPAQEKI